MKVKEIADKYGIDSESFERFLRLNKKVFNDGFFSVSVEDEYVDAYVYEYYQYTEAQRQQKLEEEQEAMRKKQAMAQMLVSSGFNFDGYKIVKYSGYISGDDATQIPRSGVYGGKNGENLTNALVRIRRQALIELKEAAYDLGCNAIIGVDFDYITLEPETANISGGTLYEPYIICVTANGNAVVIEKESDAEGSPVQRQWMCTSCGKINSGSFCSNCGQPTPYSK